MKNKNIITAAILLINLIWWLTTSDVTYLIAQNRDVLLGRYSVGRFSAMLIVFIISMITIYLVRADRKNRRERIFRLIAIWMGLTMGLILVDLGARLIRSPRYFKTEDVYHRKPHKTSTGVFKDAPETRLSYPRTPPGYPDIKYTITTDKRGFRNKVDLDKCELLTLGDSFTEGSSVSDEHAWPAVYSEKSGRVVCNLAMAGGNPSTYVETLELFGLSLKPDIVLCMIYEGNDFRGSGELAGRLKKRATLKKRIRSYYKTSPVRLNLKKFFIDTLSFERKTETEKEIKPKTIPELSWLPIVVPDAPDSPNYTFTVKKLETHYESKKDFVDSPGFKTASIALKKINRLCEENNSRFIVVYAPDKPHVLVPMISDRIPHEKLKAFLAIRKKNLPPPDETVRTLLANMDAQEEAVRELCAQESIEFISLTNELRRTILKGNHAYYTYDMHWSPIGHRVAAETVYRYLDEGHPSNQSADPMPSPALYP